MLRQRELETAIQFDIVEKIEKLKADLLQVDAVTEVEFDLDGFYDNMNQIIFLTKYNISKCPEMEKYYDKRRLLIRNVISVANENDLRRTEDSIEDYGEHFYFVMKCGKEWKTK